MAFDYLNPVTTIWLQSGLRHILQLEEPAAEAPVQVQPRPAPRPVRPQSANALQPQKNKETSWRPLPLEEWPEQWRELFARTKKGRIAWTYPKLGQDLLAAAKPQTERDDSQARAARSQILRRLLSGLGHPAGTHTFWPAQLAYGSMPDIDVFWSGLQTLGCRGVIIMDPAYAQLLCSDARMRAYTQSTYRGEFLWPLPAIDNLDADYQRIIAYLRRILKPFAGVA